MWTQNKRWRVRRRHWSHWICLDSLLQKTPIITPKKRTLQPGDAFEDTALKLGFKIVEFWNQLVESRSSLLCKIDSTNDLLTSCSFRWRPSSASYSTINLCSTAGKRIEDWDCDATYGHRNTTLFTAIVYDHTKVHPQFPTGRSSVICNTPTRNKPVTSFFNNSIILHQNSSLLQLNIM